jgi:hypothetical protein
MNYHLIRARIPQGGILGPLLYLIFTADVPLTEKTLMATFADDTAILSSDHDPNAASQKLQWKITLNPAKSSQITFTTRRAICPQVSINNFLIPIKEEVKYLGLHLDQKTIMADTYKS